MENFFAGDYTGPAFQFLGTAHLGALAVLVLLNLYLLRFKHADEATRAPASAGRWRSFCGATRLPGMPGTMPSAGGQSRPCCLCTCAVCWYGLAR